MNTELITIEREAFEKLLSAAQDAREWMATQAPASEWANRVRQNLNAALTVKTPVCEITLDEKPA